MTTVGDTPTAAGSDPFAPIQLLLSRFPTMQAYSSSSTTPPTGSGATSYPSSYGQQSTMQQAQERMSGFFERIRTSLQAWIQNSADTLRVYVNQYPPLAAFLFTLLILSALPISVFVIFGLVTTGIFLTIALVGFSVVEGFVLLTSGGVLMAILGGIAFFTTIGFVLISGIYLSYRGGCALCSQVWQGAGQFTGQMKEAAQRVGSTMQQAMGGQQSGTYSGVSGAGPMSGLSPTSS